MGPKVEAAAQFARHTGRSAVIGSLEMLPAMIAGDGGTRISVLVEGMTTS
jgi:carbamate kinase